MSSKASVPRNTSRTYQITVEGKIDPSWSDWLGGVQLVSRKEAGDMPITLLQADTIDQTALRGLLDRLWDLNLVLRSVQQMDQPNFSDQE